MSAERLFISHASEDAETVNAIVAYLEARGVACWIASRDIPPRSIYAEAITEGIETCSACAVVVSAASNASDAVKRELELASHYKKPFIPIRIDATEPGRGLAYYLRNVQWVDCRRDLSSALDALMASMNGQAAAPLASVPRNIHELGNTTWRGTWGTMPIMWRFEMDGTAGMKRAEEPFERNSLRWRLEGSKLTLESDRDRHRWVGTVIGSDITGTDDYLYKPFSVKRDPFL